MTIIWEKFAEFWEVWGPFVATSLIPTIIVGLSVSPKTAEAKTLVEKIWNFIKQGLEYLSIATPKDKPGTFQLPLKLGELSKKKTDVSTTILMVFVLSVPIQGGCSWLKGTGQEVKAVVIDCSVTSVQDNARNLIPALVGILKGAAVNWKEQVKLFVKEFGRDATACALQVALQRLNAPIAAEAEENPEAVRIESVKRAGQYINEQKWQFSN